MADHDIDAVAAYLAAKELEDALNADYQEDALNGDDHARACLAFSELRGYLPEPTSEEWAQKYADALDLKEGAMESMKSNRETNKKRLEWLDNRVKSLEKVICKATENTGLEISWRTGDDGNLVDVVVAQDCAGEGKAKHSPNPDSSGTSSPYRHPFIDPEQWKRVREQMEEGGSSKVR